MLKLHSLNEMEDNNTIDVQQDPEEEVGVIPGSEHEGSERVQEEDERHSRTRDMMF